MVQEFSFGIIPIRKNKGIWEVLLVQHVQGHWSLPKGRQEGQESPLECAKRELFEETSLSIVQILLPDPLFEHYSFKRKDIPIEKTVGYFLAEVTGEEKLQLQELQNSKWVRLSEADQHATFDQIKNVLKRAHNIIFHQNQQ
jgi:bis(5'-nucleosidyl)-tetraphosphatase